MHDDVIYSFEDGPVKNMPLKGSTWKKLIADSKNGNNDKQQVEAGGHGVGNGE
jgi:hypothetical protein